MYVRGQTYMCMCSWNVHLMISSRNLLLCQLLGYTFFMTVYIYPLKHNCVHRIQLLETIMSQFNPVYKLRNCFFKIISCAFPFTLTSAKPATHV